MTWKLPDHFPDLSSAKMISIDCETFDPDLKKKGPGVYRNGYITGVAVATDDGFQGYFPVRHEEGPNLDSRAVFRWLKEEMGRDQIKVGANILYDAQYLKYQGVVLEGEWVDVLCAEPLLDENAREYSLEAVAQRRLGEGKLEDPLTIYCQNKGWKGNPKNHLWKMPASVVGPYAMVDTTLPFKVFKKQWPLLKNEELDQLFRLEMTLTKLLLKMRETGVRIDSTRLEKVIVEYRHKRSELKSHLDYMAGYQVDIWAAASIAKFFDKESLPYPLTPKNRQPSFTQDFLERHEHPFAKRVVEMRKIDKFIETFLVGQLQSMIINGRIHGQFNQLKGEEGGTVTGRLSGSHPNLQFIPARDEEMGPLCRSMFIPEEGCKWGKADYSQIEYRYFSHFAMGPGAEEVRRQYNENPEIDFHQMTADMVGVSRKEAKNINFGIIYGMGVNKLCAQLGRSKEAGQKILDEYFNRIPFVKHMLNLAMTTAENRGYVKTVLGRRRRFTLYEPADWGLSKKYPPMKKEEAISLVNEHRKKDPTIRPGVKRAGTHRALNSVVQGSAADQTKKAMVDCFKAGICDVLPLHLTVHDELDVSVPPTKEGQEAFKEMIRLMEEAIPLKVPIKVDWKLGTNWGEC